ncbi:cation:proton antiporter [Nocardia stercoris]|uniref:Sodium:proton exchanger n=1 Tax=Nocardia stercoris TaxID=2483361 RepID=A0A3M2L8K7_9NOCA|nr:cation:proton antiporter [Nocardia stercoris]RMI32255.1 sodium:proton exchanger [Nocardia stercoris]
MFLAITATMAVILAWACVSGAFARWSVTAPVAMIVVGLVVGATSEHWILESLNTHTAQRVVEFLLALSLFDDATEIQARVVGRTGVARMLVAFVGSLALATFAGKYVLDQNSWALLLLIACVVMPTDLVPARAVLTDRRITQRVRDTLNIESGLNDGLAAPIFLFALEACKRSADSDQALEALGHAVPAVLKSVLVGVPVGAAAGILLTRCATRGWTEPHTVRCGLLAVPVLTYALAVLIDGNGFVAAFLAGLTYRTVHGDIPGEPLELTEGLGRFLSLGLWFIVGNIAIGIPWLDWHALVYGLLALTVFRIVPVWLALLGSHFTTAERIMLSALGPRGVATIVFGLLAVNGLTARSDIRLLVGVTLFVVTGSVLLHGIGAPLLADRLSRRPETAAAQNLPPRLIRREPSEPPKEPGP